MYPYLQNWKRVHGRIGLWQEVDLLITKILRPKEKLEEEYKQHPFAIHQYMPLVNTLMHLLYFYGEPFESKLQAS